MSGPDETGENEYLIKNIDTIYTEKVIIDITVKKEDYDGFEKKVVEATNGKAVFGEREEAEFVVE